MNEQQGTEQTGAAKARTAPAAARQRARLVFGDPLDRQSRDDTDRGWGGRPDRGDSGERGLDWYLSQKPPHHG